MIRSVTFTRLAGLAFLIVAGFGMATAAWAQGGNGELKNIRSFKFFITGFSEYNKQCGLNQDAIERAFTKPLTDAGLKIAQSSTAYWITLRVTSVPYGERACISYIDASAMQTTRYFNNATLGERVGSVQHWSGGKLIISDIEEHVIMTNSAFRGLGRDLLATWRRDQ